VECPQVESRDGALFPIVPGCTVVLVALTALVPFLVNRRKYRNACPEPCDAFIDLPFLW